MENHYIKIKIKKGEEIVRKIKVRRERKRMKRKIRKIRKKLQKKK